MSKNKIIKLSSIISILLLCSGCTNQEQEVIAIDDNKINKTVTISAVGDVMVHSAQLSAQMKNDGTYDFDNNFKHIKNIIKESDLSIANLETTVNKNKNYSGYPSFNSPPQLLESLKDTGFDIISTINNHSLDTGYSGVLSTIEELNNVGLEPVGTKLNIEDKNYIIKTINDIKIGITSFSYGDVKSNQKYLNGIPSGKAYNLLNVIDSSNIEEAFNTINTEIEFMKNEGAEFIIVGLHWGVEYKQTPNEYQKQLAQKLCNTGVDLILGSHPHVVQPMEFIKSELNSEHETLVVYSMGNIISNQREEMMGFKESENGLIPIIDIIKENEDVKIYKASYIPTWVNKDVKEGKIFYEVIPLHKNLDDLANTHNISINDLTTSFNNTTCLMSDSEINLYKN